MYLGSIVMTAWLNLKSEPSVSMLFHYWKYYDRLRPGAQTAFEVSVFIALLIPIVVAVIICAAMLMNQNVNCMDRRALPIVWKSLSWSVEKEIYR